MVSEAAKALKLHAQGEEIQVITQIQKSGLGLVTFLNTPLANKASAVKSRILQPMLPFGAQDTQSQGAV